MNRQDHKICIIIAHPDDETLWAGGLILLHPEWDFYIYSLTRSGDPDRSPKFYETLRFLNAQGNMADLDDGPEQTPLTEEVLHRTILDFTSGLQFDKVITHGIKGEYTRHLRHEEVSKAVTKLWLEGKIQATELWQFAYNDNHGPDLPKANQKADLFLPLPHDVWLTKEKIICEIYGFAKDSWEARVTPGEEAFYCFTSILDYKDRLK